MSCLCFIFQPMSTLTQCIKHNVKTNFVRAILPETNIVCSMLSLVGTTPQVYVPLSSNTIDLTLVSSANNELIIVGLQVSRNDVVTVN